MAHKIEINAESLGIARRWCESRGPGWSVNNQLGKGGTAPVFEVDSPAGTRALKVYDAAFSSGEKGKVELKRIEQQVALQGHNCPSLVQVYEGGKFEDRLFLVMSRAPGSELETRLKEVPRDKIRHIVDQVARAAMFLRSKDLCHRDIKSANIFVSDDFAQITLLDISVTRNIYDPVGVGTDHDGQLPVVATARYSPPEYLFRLLEPSPELWHALDIYQLSALLHDLIVRQPLFQPEYLNAAENRYRFAWIVATTIPPVEVHDVDKDLIFLARRGLDKDWKRRSSLRLEDFLIDLEVQKSHALEFLGLGEQPNLVPQQPNLFARLERIRVVASNLEDMIVEYLRGKNVTANHMIKPGVDDFSKFLRFKWVAPAPSAKTPGIVELELLLRLESTFDKLFFNSSVSLRVAIDNAENQGSLELPAIEDAPGVEAPLAAQMEAALAELGVKLTRA